MNAVPSVPLKRAAQSLRRPATARATYVGLEHVGSRTGALESGFGMETSDAATAVQFARGDVLFGKLRPYLAKSLLAEFDGICSSEFLVLRAGHTLEPKFLAYLVQGDAFIEWTVTTSDGAKMPRTGWEEVGAFRLALPALDVQRAITDFLDDETARIDRIVEANLRMLQLFEERRDAEVIHKMIPTPFPRGWRKIELRRLECEVQTGPFGSQLHAEDYVTGGWPVVNPINMIGGRIVPNQDVTVTDATRSNLSRHVLRHGDVVVARRGEFGRAARVGLKEEGWLCGTGCLRIRLAHASLHSEYLWRFLQLPPVRQELEAASVGSTMDNLNTDILLRLALVLPDEIALNGLLNELRSVDERFRSVRDARERQIALLRERRQALITAAVTGQIEIPAA